MSDAKKQTIIEEGTEVDGSISSRCDIVLRGTLKGELLAPALTVHSSGSVHGCVKVEQLVSEGEISGEIDAESVDLSGRVSDQTVIKADSLEVRLSQPDEGIRVTFGDCQLRVGDKPAKRSKRRTAGSEKTESKPTPAEMESEPTI